MYMYMYMHVYTCIEQLGVAWGQAYMHIADSVLPIILFYEFLQVSIAAMKSFHTIIDPQTPSPSPRSSLVGRHSRSPSRDITPPPSLSADSSGTSWMYLCMCVCALNFVSTNNLGEEIAPPCPLYSLGVEFEYNNDIIHDNSRFSLIPNMDRLCTGTCMFVIT